jgi:ABC-type transporter Mla subunit MlaD
MSGKHNFFKIGLFTLLAMFLFLAGIMAFGLSSSLAPKLECVTLFNRSVRGLSVGSAVNFRGFKVGQISGISLSAATDKNSEPSVRVSFYIEPASLIGKDSSEEEARDYIFGQIEQGLKVYLSFQGVTGLGFLDLDYDAGAKENSSQANFNTLRERSLELGEVQIPNGPGSIMEISESATQIVKSLSGVDFSGISRDIKSLVGTFEKAVADLQTDKISADMTQTLNEMRGMAEDISALAASLDTSIGQNSLGKVGTEMEAAIKQLRQTIRRTELLLNSSQNNLPATMDNLRVMSENMRELSELLKRYPSQLFFGQPPQEIRPGQTRR